MQTHFIAVALLVVVAMALLDSGQADFADAEGFSGRFGFDCTACHVAPGYGDPATLVVKGLPAAWDADATYLVTVRIDGGPFAVPVLQPQGGFEADTDGGSFQTAPGMEGLTRTFAGSGLTYTPAGTLMRQWDMLWQAPELEDLTAPPGTIGIWVAGVAANGNHVIATNTSDLGEHGDQVATFTEQVPASGATLAAWNSLPLAPIEPQSTIVRADGDRVVLRGSHGDPLADVVAWSVDGGPWQHRDSGPTWSVALDDLRGGRHDVQVRSEGQGRASLAAHILVEVEEGFLDKLTPGPAPLLVAVALFAMVWVRRPT